MPPMMVMTSATTVAKIGRSIKKRLIGIRWTSGSARQPGKAGTSVAGLWISGRRRGHGDRRALGLHFQAGARALQPLGDHPVLGADAFPHHPQALDQRSETNVAPPNDAVLAHDEDVLVGLVG